MIARSRRARKRAQRPENLPVPGAGDRVHVPRVPLALHPLEPRIMLSVASVPVDATMERINLSWEGNETSGLVFSPEISPDGSTGAFVSWSRTLVPNDTNSFADVFVVDRQTDTIERGSLASDGSQSNGASAEPSLSQNGRYLAFESSATNLVPGDTNGFSDIFVRDLEGQSTERVSLRSDGSQSEAGGSGAYSSAGSHEPKITPDGRWVVYTSNSTDLVPDDTNQLSDIFLYDRQTAATERVSVGSSGEQMALWCRNATISADGRYVAFRGDYYAGGMPGQEPGEGPTENSTYAYLKDRETGALTLINGGLNGQVEPTLGTGHPWISSNGNYVTYSSFQQDLVANDTNGYNDVFVYETQTGSVERVSVGSDGSESDGSSEQPTISGDGSVVVFRSFATNLVSDDANWSGDIFGHDRQTGQTQRLSMGHDGSEADADSYWPHIDDSGWAVAFESYASNLVPDDTNGGKDIFVFSSTPPPTYPAVTQHSPTGTLPGPVSSVDVHFSESMDTASFSIVDDVGSFMGPGGAVAVTGHSWPSSDILQLTFPTVTQKGDYTLSLGPGLLDLDGNAMDQDGNGTPGEPEADAYRAQFTIDPDYPRVAAHRPVSDQLQPVSAMQFDFSKPIDPASFDPAQDVASFTGPGGSIPVTGHNWVDQDTLEIGFAQQTADGDYELVLGPDLRDDHGGRLDQDQDDTAGEATDDQYTGTFRIAWNGPRITSQTPTGVINTDLASLTLGFDEPMDSTSFALADDVVSFTGPGGAIQPTGHSWLDDRTLEVTFPRQTTNGQYTLVLGVNILDSTGVAMDQDEDRAPGEDPDDRYTATVELQAPLLVSGHTPTGDLLPPVAQIDIQFGDTLLGGSFTTDDVAVVGPQGAVTVTGAPTFLSGNEYRISFEAQETPGTYHVYVGPDVQNSLGLKMDQDRDGVLGEATDDRYDATFNIVDLVGPKVTGHAPSAPTQGPLDSLTLDFDETIDPASFTADDVLLTGPGGPIEVTGVTAVDQDTLRVDFAAQNTAGSYTIVVGPNIADSAGNVMDQDGDGQKGEAGDDRYQALLNVDVTGPQITDHSVAGVLNVPLSSFDLDFDEAMSAGSFDREQVTVTGPNGVAPASRVTPIGPDRLRVEVNASAVDGQFHVQVDPAMTDVAGNPLDQDRNGVGGEAGDAFKFDFVQQLPDLTVTSVSGPVEGREGKNVTVEWTVTNAGAGVATGTWSDELRLSDSADAGTEVELGVLAFDPGPSGLAPGSSYTRATSVALPSGIAGSYWLVVDADAEKELAEANEDDNAMTDGTSLLVTSRPYPDLQVTQVSVPTGLPVGDWATARWTVQNFGTGSTTSQAWHDGLHLSQDQALDDGDVSIVHVQNPDFLASGETYDQSTQFLVPDTLPFGQWYLLVATDQREAVQEFDLEHNNVGSTGLPVEATAPGVPFLSVTDVDPPATVEPGALPEISYQITNTGGATIHTGWSSGTGWDDGLAFSRDATYDPQEDFWLGSHNYWHGLPLRPGESYTNTGVPEHPIPAWEPGTYYVIVVPDTHFGAGTTFENSTIGRDYGVHQVELVISQPCDLVVTDVTAPGQAGSGQLLSVEWTVTNSGAGRTVAREWDDAVYLSADPTLDASDLKIGDVKNETEIHPKGQVQASGSLRIPGGAAGDFYVIVAADSSGSVPEGDEGNNARASAAPVSISLSQSDLVPTIDSAPAAGLAGGPIEVRWTVRNDGIDPTYVGEWRDRVYLSTDAVLDPTQDEQIAEFAYSAGSLGANASYPRTESIDVERGIEGDFYLFVVTDADDALYEHNGEANNAVHPGSTIQIQDLAPDLEVQSFNAPSTAIAGRAIDLDWSIWNRNDASATALASWDDVLFLSDDNALERDQDPVLATIQRTADLAVADAYGPSGGTYQADLPDGISGDYYLFLVTDRDDALYEKGAKANNVSMAGPLVITDLKPDLVVSTASAPATGTAGALIPVDFTIGNSGQETAVGSWGDAFYLSVDTQFDPVDDLLFGVAGHSQDVAVDDTYCGAVQLRLPDRTHGSHHIFVVPDYADALDEVNEADAFLSPQPIQVTCLPPDLEVTQISGPSEATAGQPIRVAWTVDNTGAVPTSEANWVDGVFLSADATFDPAGDVELGRADHLGSLGVGESYSATEWFTLRQDLEGSCHLYVYTDVQHQVFEYDREGNNTTETANPLVVTGVHADLQVSALAVPANGLTGQTVQIDWTGVNVGPDATAVLSWADRVFLSSDTQLDDADLLLGEYRHDGPLGAGQTYPQGALATLPADRTGDLFVLVKVDAAAGNEVFESQAEGNNVAAAAIHVDYAPSPDLQITNVTIPATGWSGQSLHVEWTAANQGGAAATGQAGQTTGWFDSVYLSRDPYVDRDSDFYLGAVSYSGTLAPGAEYAAPQSMDALLGAGLSGPYYVLVHADANNRVSERGNEHNNVGAAVGLVDVELTPPCDLQVTDITVPPATPYGETTDFTYEVTNQDTLDARGSWYDTVYLSRDDQWSLDDLRVGRVLHEGDVLHGQSYTETLSANVPGLVPGEYYVIVRTDILDQVREIDDTNNTGVATDLFIVEGRPLAFNQARPGTLAGGQTAYYEISVNAGADLLVSLTGNGARRSELYIANSYIPTRSRYEERALWTTDTDPSLRFPNTEAGTHYVMIYGNHRDPADDYAITASLLGLDVTAVTPNVAGNVGDVTLGIEGQALPLLPNVCLVSDAGDRIYANRIYPGDSSHFYATFDLSGQTPGLYDVEVQGDDSFAFGADLLSIQAGVGAELEARLDVPGVLRPGFPFTITVNYTNRGDTDMVSPILGVTGPSDLGFGLYPGEYESTGSIRFLAYSDTGPAGVIQPGDTQSVLLHCSGVEPGSHQYTLTSLQVDPANPTPELIDWDALEDQYRPAYLTDAEWATEWRVFSHEAGATWAEVTMNLAEMVTATPHHSLPNILVEDLMQDLFRSLTGQGGGGLLDRTAPYVSSHIAVEPSPGVVSGVDLILSEAVDPTTFGLDDVVLLDPGLNPIAPTAVTALSDRMWRVSFDPQTALGVYSLATGFGLADLSGLSLDQDRDGRLNEVQDDVHHATFSIAEGGASSPTFITSISPSAPQPQSAGLDHVIVNLNQPIHALTFTPSDVTLAGPDGVAVDVTSVSQLTSTQYLATFSPQSLAGAYRLVIGSDILGLDLIPLAQPDGGPFQWDLEMQDMDGPQVASHTPNDTVEPPITTFRVTFNEAIDPASFTTVQVKSIRDPDRTAIAATNVRQISSTVFEVVFPEQTKGGQYQFTLSEDIRDVNGNKMNEWVDELNGQPNDTYRGSFWVLPAALTIGGRVIYDGDLAEYFPNGAHVAVELWEQNGARDAEAGIPDEYDDEADHLISDWNLFSGKQRTEYGHDFTNSEGGFMFAYDMNGERILNEDSSTQESEKGTTRDLYIRVFTANKYGLCVDRDTLRDSDPSGDAAARLYTNWSPLHPGPGHSAPSGSSEEWGRLYYVLANLWVLDAGPQDVTVDFRVSDPKFGFSEWLHFGGTWVEAAIGEDARRAVAVKYPGPNAARAFFSFSRDTITMGTDYIHGIGPTLLHEYGHALQYALNEYRSFPYGDASYGMIQVSALEAVAFAEGWAQFVSNKSMDGLSLEPFLKPPVPTDLFTIHRNRSNEGGRVELNDWWLAWDAFRFANNDEADDREMAAWQLAERFEDDSINNDGNTGRNVMGAIMSAMWDLADGKTMSFPGMAVVPEFPLVGLMPSTWLMPEDGISDIEGLYRAMDTVNNSAGQRSNRYIYRDFYAAYQEDSPDPDESKAIFIDHGYPIPQADDDRYDGVDVQAEFGDKGHIVKEPPFEIANLILSEGGKGDGDWFWTDLEKTEDDPKKAQAYDLTVGIEFQKRYGDLDLLVRVFEDGDTSEVVSQSYVIRRGHARETIKVTGLDNGKTYRLNIGVVGHGAMVPKTGVAWDFDVNVGDMNPDYRLFVQVGIPEPDPQEEEDQAEQITRGSVDPNDKLAPDGFGEGRYLAGAPVMPYTIRFENKEDATASCVLITITDQLDADFDWPSFELGDVQFGEYFIDVPEGHQYYQTVYDLRPFGNDLLIDVEAGLDLQTGLAQWTFTALDPETGEPTVDPFAGFLPPNNPNVHDGEGSVQYSIQPKTNLPSGTELTNAATIVFDWNEPIDTPVVLNTIDAGGPTSAVDALPATTNTSSFQVTWTGADDAGGSGVANFDVYVSDDGGPFELWLEDTTATRGWYDGVDGHTYSFYSRALDNVGHQEGEKLAAEATTQLDVQQAQRVLAPDRGNISHSITYIDGDGDLVTVTFTAPVGNTATLTRRIVDWDDQGDLFSIDVSGNDDRMSIDIHVQESGDVLDCGTTLGSVFGDELWRFYAPQVDLIGNTIVLDGPLRWLTLRDIEDGSDITLGGETTDRLTMVAGEVGDVDLTFPGILHEATVVDWADGVIDVNYIVTLRTTSGDFGADLVLSGADASGCSLGSAIIAGDLTADTWTIPGSARRVHVEGDASTDLDLTGDLGWMFKRRRGGQRRWYAQGLWVGGHLNGNVDVDGDLIRMDVGGDVTGDIDAGGNIGVAYRRRSGARVRWITMGITCGGRLTGDVQAGGNVVRIETGGDVTGAVDITGDLGVALRQRSRNSTRWIATGLSCGGDMTGNFQVGGEVLRMDVDGDVDGDVDITGQLGTSLRQRSSRRTRWLTTGLSCAGNVTGDFQVGGDVVRMDVDGNVTGAVDITGDLGVWLKQRSRRRARWITAGLWCSGSLTSNFTVGADVARMDVQGDVTGPIDVTGDLGARVRRTVNGRRRWVTRGLWCGGNVTANLRTGGTACSIDIDGDFANATVEARVLQAMTVDGAIRSLGAQLVRALLAGSRFYISDATWSGYVSAGNVHVFGGSVTAQIG